MVYKSTTQTSTEQSSPSNPLPSVSKKQILDPTLPSRYEDTMDTSKTVKQIFVQVVVSPSLSAPSLKARKFPYNQISNSNLLLIDLNNIIRQLPKPFLFLGDFNSRNPIWGSNYTDARGKIVEKFLNNDQIILLNTG
ncbi:hypothetical protein QTP88_012419 [Uroleucon formosanum]